MPTITTAQIKSTLQSAKQSAENKLHSAGQSTKDALKKAAEKTRNAGNRLILLIPKDYKGQGSSLNDLVRTADELGIEVQYDEKNGTAITKQVFGTAEKLIGLTERGVTIFAPKLDKLLQKYQKAGNKLGGSAENIGDNLGKAGGILSTFQNFLGTALSSMKIDELIKKQKSGGNVSSSEMAEASIELINQLVDTAASLNNNVNSFSQQLNTLGSVLSNTKHLNGVGNKLQNLPNLDNIGAGLDTVSGILSTISASFILSNADADTATAAQIADNFVSEDMDLICAIATPSAQAAYNSAVNTEIPVVYTAVTNPEEAELATEDKMPVGAVTGTSDQLPVEAQLQMIRKLLPKAKTIGILYTTSEANSAYSIKQYEKYAEDYGFTIETAGVTNTSEVSLAAAGLLEKVDCLTNLTDNTVVSALPTILSQAEEAKIPVFGSEIEQVKLGCLAAEGLDYVNLGKETGKMAAKILKGEAKAEEMEYELLTDSSLYINEKAAENLGIEIPEDMKNEATEVFTEITEE